MSDRARQFRDALIVAGFCECIKNIDRDLRADAEFDDRSAKEIAEDEVAKLYSNSKRMTEFAYPGELDD